MRTRLLAMMTAAVVFGGAAIVVSTPSIAAADAASSSHVGSADGYYQDADIGLPPHETNADRSAPGPDPAYLAPHVERDRGAPDRSPGGPTGEVSAAAAVTRCPAFVTWEDWVGGARVHAYVDFHPSDWCNGRHVKRAYVRLIRQCGPYYDTGRIYSYTAGSPNDTRLYSVSAWIFDSVLWSCNTNTYYGYEYF